MLDSSTLPVMKECDKNSKSAKYLRQLRKTALSKYGHIKAVLVVSAHWVEPKFTVQKLTQPHLYYDYYRFPDEAYHLEWKVPGSPDVADRTAELLKKAGIDCMVNTTRGLDHGVFVPLKLVFQEADIPGLLNVFK
jgi:aromatic ring-opening dioxygenase catalytic subunit (LigB family)